MPRQRPPTAGLTPGERRAAAETAVWIAWWELPDKSWVALCRSREEAQAELRRRQEDHVVQTWGEAGVQDPQSLLEWFERQAGGMPGDAAEYLAAVREVLRRAGNGEPGAVTVRTW